MDKYYIYRHIRLDIDEVFYIGRGTKSKTFSKTIENEYKSLTEASEELNITIPAISKALKNEKYTARGYKWKYKSL